MLQRGAHLTLIGQFLEQTLISRDHQQVRSGWIQSGYKMTGKIRNSWGLEINDFGATQ